MRLALVAAGLAAASAASSCTSTSCAAPGSCPSDDPVASFSSPGFNPPAYSFTSTLVSWASVYSTADYGGTATSLQLAILAAAAAARACVGSSASSPLAVVYVPSGNHTLPAGPLFVPPGIVLRGAPPPPGKDAAKDGVKEGPLAPPTVLTFPALSLSSVGCAPNGTAVPTCAPGVGVVHLTLDGAGVTIAGGTGAALALVFGNRITNVNYKYPAGPGGPQGGNVWPYRFSTAISVVQNPNAAVVNNLIAPATLRFNTTVTLKDGTKPNVTLTVPFPVDNRYGIILGGSSPASPSLNMSVDSNYVYMNGRVGVSWSSYPATVPPKAPGGGVRVVNNHVEVAANTTAWSVDGVNVCSPSATNENRGYDQSGTGGSVVANNTGSIHRQRAGNSSYDTVDGEGCLQQTQDGLSAYGNIWEGNDLSGGTSGYMAYWDIKTIQGNVVRGNTVVEGQSIGVLDCRGCTATGNTCEGNSVPCTGM